MKKFLLTFGLTATSLCVMASVNTAYPLDKGSTLLPSQKIYKVSNEAPGIVNPLEDENNDAPVFTRPEGTSKLYSRNSSGYSGAAGVQLKQDRGLAVEIITAEDGTMWMNNPFSQYDCQSWLKCTVEGDVMTIALPQPVATFINNGKQYTYYASRLKYDYDATWFYTTEDQNFTFKIDGDQIIDTTGGDLLGMTYLTEDPATGKTFYTWASYGDYYIEMQEHTAVPQTAPEGLDMEQWAIVTDTEGHEINLGFDEDRNLWVQGMLRSLPYAWTKGVLNDDNIYNFASEQYLGIDPSNRHFTYFSGGRTERRYDEVNQIYVDVQGVIPELSMKYFPELKRLVSNAGENILITTNTIEASSKNGLAYIYLYKTPRLQYQDRKPGVPPRPIIVTGYLPYSKYVAYGGMSFDLPYVDMNDMLLDPLGISYEMFVDGELFTFYPDEYRSLAKPLTRIPYYYSDGLDFMCQGVDHILYFFFEGYDSIQIRSVYSEGGVDTYSELVEITTWNDKNPRVEDLESNHGEVVNVEYFDLTGMPVTNPTNTLCIVRKVYSDGTVKTEKQILK